MRWVVLIILLSAVPAWAQYAEHYPRELLAYENSVCRVSVAEAGGVQAHGSGVLIRPPEHYRKLHRDYVLTAYHVVKDRRGAVTVTWNGVDRFLAEVVAARPGCDAAVLKIPRVPEGLLRVPLARSEIRLGEQAFAFGFGGTSEGENILRCSGGTVLDLTHNIRNDAVWFDLAGKTRQGDSGGPVFVVRDKEVSVVGVAWGSGFDTRRQHHTIAATRLRVAWRLFGLETAVTNPHQGGLGGAVLVGSSPVSGSPVQAMIVSGGS